MSTVAVLFIFWLLYQQGMQVSTREPEARGPVSVFVHMVKFLSEALRTAMTQRRLNDLMILYVHKERVDGSDLDKIAKNCFW